MKNRSKTILFFILLLALGLRLWAVDFGLPHQYHQDEAHEVYRALRLGKGDFDFSRVFKGGYYYVLFAEYTGYYAYLWLAGEVSNPRDFAVRFVQDPSPFWLMGRMTTAVFGTLSVVLLYWLGRRWFGERVALLAAFLLAVAVHHVASSHYITVDVPLTFFLLLAFLSFARTSEANVRREAWRGGLLIGVAALFKFTAVLAVMPFAVAQLLNRNLDLRPWARNVATGLAVAGAIFLIGNPGILLGGVDGFGNMQGFWDNLTAIFEAMTEHQEDVDPVFLVSYSAPTPGLWKFYLSTLMRNLGVILFGFFLVGLVQALRRRSRREGLILAFLVPYFVAISASRTLSGFHYILPVLPLAILLAAWSLDRALRGLFGNKLGYGALAVASLAFLQPVYESVAFDVERARPDTRTLGREWVQTHIPLGTRLVIDRGRFRNHWAPPLPESRETLQAMLEQTDDPGKREFLRLKMQHVPERSYHLISTVWGTQVADVETYRRQGVEYFIICDAVRDRFRRPTVRQLFPKSAAFYEALETDPNVRLLKVFNSDATRGPGPTIRIYQLLPSATLTLRF